MTSSTQNQKNLMFKNFWKADLKKLYCIFCLFLISTCLFAQGDEKSNKSQEAQNISDESENQSENAKADISNEECVSENGKSTDSEDFATEVQSEDCVSEDKKPKDGWYGNVGFGLSFSQNISKKPKQDIVNDQERLKEEQSTRTSPFPVLFAGYRFKNFNFMISLDIGEAVGILPIIGYQISEPLNFSVGKFFAVIPASAWNDPYQEDRKREDIRIDSEQFSAQIFFASLGFKQTRYQYHNDLLGDKIHDLKRSGTKNNYSLGLDIPLFQKEDFNMMLNVSPSHTDYQAKGKAQNYQTNTIQVSVLSQLQKDIRVSYGFAQSQKDFKTKNPIVSKTRKDQASNHNVGFEYVINPSYSLKASYNQRTNNSNIKLFESKEMSLAVLIVMNF